MSSPIKTIRLNNVQYNPNRDPQFYRRLPDEQFRLQVSLAGSGQASISVEADGEIIAAETKKVPGTFDASFSFKTAGTRVAKLTVELDGEKTEQFIRLDVLAHAWVG